MKVRANSCEVKKRLIKLETTDCFEEVISEQKSFVRCHSRGKDWVCSNCQSAPRINVIVLNTTHAIPLICLENTPPFLHNWMFYFGGEQVQFSTYNLISRKQTTSRRNKTLGNTRQQIQKWMSIKNSVPRHAIDSATNPIVYSTQTC